MPVIIIARPVNKKRYVIKVLIVKNFIKIYNRLRPIFNKRPQYFKIEWWKLSITNTELDLIVSLVPFRLTRYLKQ
jgi:hypothetical protein